VALFGYVLPKLFPPRLRIRIADPPGARQKVQLQDRSGAVPVPVRDAWARYYQIEVTNARRWARAHNVRVMFLRLEVETIAGWVNEWSGGGIPLVWQHQQVVGSVRNVGPAGLADQVNVLHDGNAARLTLTPTFAPYGVECVYAGPLRAPSYTAGRGRRGR
jgi:hypothetical protein